MNNKDNVNLLRQKGRLALALATAIFCIGTPALHAQVIKHRWSFNDATDSVGTAGVTLVGNATISGGALNVPGGGGAHDYGSVNIASDFNTSASATIECWFTTTTINNWSKVWMFGNGGNNADAGTTYMDFTPNRGDSQAPGLSITPYPFSGGDFARAASFQLPAAVPQHAVAIYNFAANTITLYTNAQLGVSFSMQNTAISNLVCSQFRFGAGTSWGDTSFNGTIDEMRVYNGPISLYTIILNDAAGPNAAIPTNGATAAVHVNLTTTTMNGGATQNATATVDVPQLGLTGTDATRGITSWSSGNTNVVSVSNTGLITAVGPGSTTVSASVDGKTGTSATITVNAVFPSISQQPASATYYQAGAATFSVSALGGQLTYQWKVNGANIAGATGSSLTLNNLTVGLSGNNYSVGITNVVGGVLSSNATLTVLPVAMVNEWSFNTDGSDSIGGVFCNVAGSATISGGSLVLPGGSQHVNYADISGIAATTLTNSSMTVEGWMTVSALQNWAKPWCFGIDDNVPSSAAEFTVQNGGSQVPTVSLHDAPNQAAVGTYVSGPQPPGWIIGHEHHTAVSFDTSLNTVSLYIDGVLASSGSLGGENISNLLATTAYLGRSLWGDPDFTGSINELRIYSGPRYAYDTLISYAVGPNAILANDTLNSITITVPSTMVGNQTAQATVTGNFPGAPTQPIVAGVTGWTSSNTNAVTVNSSGLITAVGPGSATISASLAGVLGTSSSITISVVTPSISQQPASVTRYVGGSASFSVTAVGGQLTYQWKQNGNNIAGATTSALVLNNLALGSSSITVGVTNAAGGVLSSPATLTVINPPSGYVGSVVASAPAAYYRLNETSGTTAFDSYGANNGTYSGTYTLGVTGLLPASTDTAVMFTNGGTVTIPYSSSVNPSGPFSVELWDNVGSTAGGQYVVALQDRSTGSRAGYAIQHNNFTGGWDFTFGSTAVGGFSTISSPAAVAVGQTYHVVGTYDGTNANLYVNGSLVNSTPATYVSAGVGTVNLTIGTRNGNSPVAGDVIDEVAIYPVALTPNQIATHYGYGLYGTNTAPAITTDLVAAVTNYPTTTRMFTVVATGSPLLTYQWYINNVLQPAVTGPTMFMQNLQPTDNGKTIKVIVSNGINPPATSTTATLYVLTTPQLAHRWTFDVDGTDSIGGVTCNVRGAASIAGGSLLLPGGTPARNQCGEIDGICTTTLAVNDSLTIEGWVTVSNLVNWSKAWMFGNVAPLAYVDYTPQAGANGNVPSMSIAINGSEVNTRAGAHADPALWVAGVQYHVAAVYDANIDTMSMYLNGVLVDQAPMGGRTIKQMNANEAYIGAAVNFGDPDLSGSVAEMRIYPGALAGYQIAQNAVWGPGIVAGAPNLQITPAGAGSVTLKWYNGTLRSSSSLSGPWTPVPSATSPYTTSSAGAPKFYRVSVP